MGRNIWPRPTHGGAYNYYNHDNINHKSSVQCCSNMEVSVEGFYIGPCIFDIKAGESIWQFYCIGTDIGCNGMKSNSFVLGGSGGARCTWSSVIISIIFGGTGGASSSLGSIDLGGNGGGCNDLEINPCGTSLVSTSIGSLPIVVRY